MMIPSQSYCFSGIIVTLYFFFSFSFGLHTLASPTLHRCRRDQRDALLEIKHEFPIADMSSWNKSSDCCSWGAVTCDDISGQVISLELYNVDLNNSLKPSSGLFKLRYLQNLTLLNCNLHGEIPSSFGNLSHLTMLDLSLNKLVGQVPASIGNLTKLRYLRLSGNNLSGKISVLFANFTKLFTLHLSYNNFEPELLPDISRIHNLKIFSVTGNSFLGPFPTSLFTIPSLELVYLGGNQFKGPIDFGNVSLSSRLRILYLADNKFDGPIPESISKFLKLERLYLSNNLFSGPFPTSLFTIPSLELVYLGGNQFKGPIDFGNVSLSSRLRILSLTNNKFDGPIPESISKFLKLERLNLRNNLFSGPFPTSLFTIPSLQQVNLAINEFKGPIDFGNTSSSSSLIGLDLAHNNFDGQISESICKFFNLRELDLSNNKLEGKVPGCLLRLETLRLSYNSFSSFGKSTQVLDHAQMLLLRLDSNSFRGPFPHWICRLRSLEFLDLSNNSFNGSIPSCLRSITKSLQVLSLRNNNFSGFLPDVFVNGTNLNVLDVGRNRLEGKLPRSLINCQQMRFLNVEGNSFKDKFPSWLGSLRLNVLILRLNQFYGPLYHRHMSIGFHTLKVIDVSHNDFSGTFPAFYFSNWFEMSQMTTSPPEFYPYMIFNFDLPTVWGFGSYRSSMQMVHKGVDTEFEKIRTDFTVIDFSRNRFYGKIPESIGLLKGLRSLNLSSNAFTSNIPESLANLINLEALDLSHNQLSGQIPQDLGKLSYLSTMNFAHNNLQGSIPRSTQFERQNCSSFMDNLRLSNLEDICGKPHVPNLTPQESEEASEPEEKVINWIAAAIAYGPGVFCGLVIGHIFISHKHEWFMEKFRRNKPRA